MHYDFYNGDDILHPMFDDGYRREVTSINNLSKKNKIIQRK